MGTKHTEIERRWIAKGGVDPIVKESPPVELEQGYLDVPGQLRVRIITMEEPNRYQVRTAELTRKTGKGIERLEDNAEISAEAADMLLSTTPYRIRKTRYMLDGWEIDFFHDRLEGLVLVERELGSQDEEVIMPPWLHDPVEVTETLNNRQLAWTSHLLSDDSARVMAYEREIPRIVLTGGPCGGKSTIVGMLKADESLHCVPETATILMGQIGIMPEVGTVFQRTLYRVQRSFEEAAMKTAIKLGKRAVVLDRGTLDSAAFVPGGFPAYMDLVSTTPAIEYDHYDAVVMLGVLPKELYDANRHSNPVRREDWQAAVVLEKTMREIWNGHPAFNWVDGNQTLDDKVKRVKGVIDAACKKHQ